MSESKERRNARDRARRASRGVRPQVIGKVVDGMRTCTRCGETKPNTLEFFQSKGKDKAGNQLLRPECKVCMKNGVPATKPKYIYRPGDKYWHLTLLHPTKSESFWLCRCDCGVEKEFQVAHVRTGNSKSCGCMRLQLMREGNTIHGMSRTIEYSIWGGMIDRCYNPNSGNYRHWGDRGIVVCDRWRDSFEAFLEDMGKRPSPTHSIDRINNDGNYEPGNVRWATPSEQARNTRSSKTKNIIVEVGEVSDADLQNWKNSPVKEILLAATNSQLPDDLIFIDRLGQSSAIFNGTY